MSTSRLAVLASVLASVLLSSALGAQHAASAGVRHQRERAPRPQDEAAHPHRDPAALLMEIGAGATGSFAGSIPLLLIPDCLETESLRAGGKCRGEFIVGMAFFAPIATSVGVTLVARHTGSTRSIVGSWLGALVGGGAGLALGAWMHASDVPPAATYASFFLVQATGSALGSRALGRNAHRRAGAVAPRSG